MGSKKGGHTSHYITNAQSELTPQEKEMINHVLGKGKNYTVHHHTETCTVVVPNGLKTMYERIEYLNAYVQKLQNEKRRLLLAICWLQEALDKKYSLATAEQLKAYKSAYERTFDDLGYYEFIRNVSDDQPYYAMDIDAGSSPECEDRCRSSDRPEDRATD